jgi:radical SAM superfamily enzyme YgiQ (UPF0313 family)
MSEILISTLNARYNHASLGLRYLLANMGELKSQTQLIEFTIKRPTQEIVDEILAIRPRLVGFGVYIWNTTQTLAVVRELKRVAPEIIIVLGGPEVSFESETQEICQSTDFVFKGEADFAFRDFARAYLRDGQLPAEKFIACALPEVSQIVLPYDEYNEEDLKNRTLYVEASRGCPYKCEYCLSSLDKSVRNFPLEDFLSQMSGLIERGARQFKFVDRTFNLAPTISSRILQFFLEKIELGLFLHFELVPDRLPDNLKVEIEKFPAGSLQFEIGIQTWSTVVSQHVSRRQNYTRVQENLRYLREKTGVHTHTDLIVGLPGETWESFAQGFNELYALEPDEIQVGLLKRLKGTPIVRHDQTFQMLYSKLPPFEILSTRDLSKEQISQLKVFADFWDLVANSGRFPKVKEMARGSHATPFDFFYTLSLWLYQRFQRTHSIHLTDLAAALTEYAAKNQWAFEWLPVRQRGTPQSFSSTPSRQTKHLQANSQS